MLNAITIPVPGPGLIEITDTVRALVREAAVAQGLCTLFIQHTSASLLIQENDRTTARADLERWFERLVPEDDPLYTHLDEGPDDMPAHIKAALTCSSLAIPILDGAPALGRWQGVYLWEHRRHRRERQLLVHIAG